MGIYFADTGIESNIVDLRGQSGAEDGHAGLNGLQSMFVPCSTRVKHVKKQA